MSDGLTDYLKREKDFNDKYNKLQVENAELKAKTGQLIAALEIAARDYIEEYAGENPPQAAIQDEIDSCIMRATIEIELGKVNNES